MTYLSNHGKRGPTPQRNPIPGRTDQVENSAGGYVFPVDAMTTLRRFLILGTEGGSYYAGERELTRENVLGVRGAIAQHGVDAVSEIVDVSVRGRAAKQSPTLFALAIAAGSPDAETKRAALAVIPQICRTGTMLFEFAQYVEGERGWGRSLRRAIGEWYQREPEKVAYQTVKYRQRNGWTHRDLLRLAHPKAESPRTAAIMRFAAHPDTFVGDEHTERIIFGFLRAQDAKTPAESASLIREFDLPREAINTDHLNSVEVWEALLANMPITAMVRNLGTMTKLGVLKHGDANTSIVLDALKSERFAKSRIHPLAVLMALRTYASGHGFRGQASWAPIPSITDALDEAFYTSFGNVEPMGGRVMLALDVSGSMTMGQVAGTPLSPREAAAAMAMVGVRTELDPHIVGFTSGGRTARYSGAYYTGRGAEPLTPLSISAKQRLDDVVRYTNGLDFGGTDCALPMLYAADKNLDIDTFVVYTDSETWAGAIHPVQALAKYRQKRQIDAKLVVVGMVANQFSIADPKDPGMLDVVGFDTATPNLISGFARGEF